MHVEVPVTPPPAVPPAPPATLSARLIPLITLLVTAGMVAVVFTMGSPLVSNPMFLMFPAVLAVSAIAGLVNGGGRQAAAELTATRRRYLSYLHDVVLTLTSHAADQQDWMEHQHPDPAELWLMAGTPRRWERHPDHQQFCQVRVGRGVAPAAARPVVTAEVEHGEVDPVTAGALQRLLDTHAVVPDIPIAVDVRATPLLCLGGDEAGARAQARAMLCQLATFQSPADVAIVAVTGDQQRKYWDWLKWLPHHGHPDLIDDLGPVRLSYRSADAVPAATTGGRVTVMVIDGVAAHGVAGQAVSGIWIAGPSAESDVAIARPDSMSMQAAATCARRLAAHPAADAPTARMDWSGLAETVQMGQLEVPLGLTEQGRPLHLDIKESAQGGAGPHGLCLGATGSGKSELLRTVALGMIARHSPEQLNLILVDFKGGATFLDLGRAPHVSAVITNLADEAYLVDRMQDALDGEIHRRQQLLRAAGNLSGVSAYAQTRQRRTDLPALPTLFLIVDEFSELLSRHPDFIDQFVAIGRLGRSLGIHLLLASQRLDEGRLRGLDSHLSYRICLKTLTANESRAAIGVPDAHHLPATPGAAYLKIGAENPIRFQTTHVSGPAPRRVGRAVGCPGRPRVFTSAEAGRVRSADVQTDRRVLDVVLDGFVDIAAGNGPAAHRVWLPPLVSAPTLDMLLVEAPGPGRLAVPLGISDRAFEQRFLPVILDLSGAAGNVAVVGAPQSGKSTALQTLALALGHRYHPGEVQLYCLDFGGGALAALAGLPHVGAIAGRQQPDLVHRTVAHVAAVLRSREASAGVRGGDVFLLIDGWATLRHEFDSLEAVVASIAAEGLSFGVHVVLTASRWADIRPALKDQIGTRIELRLGDPVDSDLDRKRASVVPANRPGSGLAPDGFPMMVALPRFDGDATSGGLTTQVEAAAQMLAERHRGRRAPAVPVLPDHVDYHELDPPPRPLLGVGDDESNTCTAEFDEYPHLLISGETGCGKTAVLRLLCREICRTATAEAAQLYVLDPRRRLLADLDATRMAGYAATPDQNAELVHGLAQLLRGRIPGADVSAQELRERSWWSGPISYLVIDDYDLISAAAGVHPVGPLIELLPHAPDIGLRVVVAQREHPRSLYDPVTGVLRDLGAATLQLNPEDGRTRQWRPGRALLTTRRGRRQVQVAWVAPA